MDNNTGKPTVNNGKRRFPMKNEYAKIGLMLFIVVAGSILFYFSFFKEDVYKRQLLYLGHH